MADLPDDDPEDGFHQAIDAFRKRVPMPRADWNALADKARERAFTVSEVASADLITEVWEAIDKAIAEGTTLAEFKADVGQKLEDHWGTEKPGRLETIFRTNVMTAYGEGRNDILTEPAVKEARPYWRFEGVEDSRQSDICDALNDIVMPADSPFWDTHTPPLHPNCRSQIVPLSEEEANDEGLTTEPPDVDAAEGFGAQPSSTGEDWEPDLEDYPEPIAAELKGRLG